jgi:RHS repeat-associated protein
MVQRCLRILLCLAICAGNPLTGSAFTSTIGAAQGVRIYLNPNTGRFWTMDSFEGNNQDPLSLHKYLYCNANPINGIDPSGHDNMPTILVNMVGQAYVQAAKFVIARPIMARVAGLVIGATLMSALEIEPDALQGLPGFQGVGALEAGEVKLLAALKRGPVYNALTASLKGMLSREDGLAFQQFLEKNVFKAAQAMNQRVSQVTKHEVDFVLDSAVIEAKTTAKIKAGQLAAIANYAKREGKDFWYVFLEKPGKSVIEKVKQAGGKVGWFLDETDK